MSTVIQKAGKTYGRKLFGQHLEQYTPKDPLYEHYIDNRGVERRRKRAIPPGLSKRDAAILKSVQKRAHYLDKGFQIAGMRFGWTFFIGLVPVVGDVTDATLNYMLVVRKARQVDIPPWLLRKMLVNNAVSAGVGFIPVVGDIILAMFKANSRNAHLLEEFLRIRGEEFIKMGGVVEDNGQGGGWLTSLVNKALKHGISPKDAEQIKPGAGMTAEEIKVAGKMPAMAASTDGNGATTTAVMAPAAAQTMSKKGSPGKKSSSFSFFTPSRKRTSPDASTTPQTGIVDKGRFVEDVK